MAPLSREHRAYLARELGVLAAGKRNLVFVIGQLASRILPTAIHVAGSAPPILLIVVVLRLRQRVRCSRRGCLPDWNRRPDAGTSAVQEPAQGGDTGGLCGHTDTRGLHDIETVIAAWKDVQLGGDACP